MKGRKLWVGTDRGGRVPVTWAPVWGPVGECPVHVQVFSEGQMLYFASGVVEVVLSVLPIIVRLACGVAGGRFRWHVAEALRRELVVALRKITQTPGSPAQSGPGASDAEQWPNLWEHLTATTYPDGSARQTSAVIIVADVSGWRGCVSDKDNGRTLWRTADSVEGLLLALEEALAADDPTAWRQAGGGFKNRRKRS